MKSIAIFLVSFSILAQVVPVNRLTNQISVKPELQQISIKPSQLESNTQSLQEQLRAYEELLRNVDNIQLRDGTVLDIRFDQTQTRSMIEGGTGAGG